MMSRSGRPDRVLVVGAGIAGLATARALQRSGVECDVVERAESWSHPGVGMFLPANSVRALDRLGLQRPVLECAQPIARQRFLDHRGRLLLEVDLADVWGSTGPCLALGRRDLHEVLRDGIAVRMAMPVATISRDEARVHAVFADGSSVAYDLVIGADGVRSSIRTAACGGSGPDYVRQASWRFLADGFPDVSSWTVWLGHGKGFLALPLGGGRLYCYADLDAAEPVDPTQGDPTALAGLFGRFAQPVPTILAAGLATGRAPYFSPIEQVTHETWVHQGVALVGDAAHAMSPNMAQGVGMALEDALVLAETLAAGRPIEAFQARQRPRVAFAQAQTRRRDRTRRLPSGVRNAVLRLAGRRIFQSSYTPLRAEP